MFTKHFHRSCAEAKQKPYIFCTGSCAEEKHESAFPPEGTIQMRKIRQYRHAVCSVCMKLRSVSVSKAIEESKKLSICENCGQSREGSEYENVTLRNHIVNETLYDLVCLHRDASQLSRCTKDVYRCGTCQKMLPAVELSVQRRKSHQDAKFLKCGMCERPPCFSCGARPEKPLTNQNEVVKSLKDRAKYRCMRCKYPPCAKCGMKDRVCVSGKDCH